MNLLSSAALRELRAVIDERSEGSPPRSTSLEIPRGARDDGAGGATQGRVLVFRSGRDHIFAAGADMAEMAGFSAAEARAFARLGQETFAAIERLPFVTVAIIDGDCFGGALDLVLSFDLRFATPRARFAHPGARLGIVTGFGGTSRWRKALDRPAARRLFLGNEVLSAADAHALGVVDCVAESFDDELARLAALDPATTRFVKELARAGERLSPSQLALLGGRLGGVYFG
jgi:enoyl-CoA hydratase/carnithine racemase